MKKKLIVLSLIFGTIFIILINSKEKETYSLPMNEDDVVDITSCFNGNDTEKKECEKSIGVDATSEDENYNTLDGVLKNFAVSTAKHYFFKRTMTDYEQTSMDDSQNAGEWSTFLFRNFRNEPEELHRGNYVNFDCSSFGTNIYLNSFGYFFGDYYNATYTNMFNVNYDRTEATHYNPEDKSMTKPTFLDENVSPGGRNFTYNFNLPSDSTENPAKYTSGKNSMSDFYNMTLRAGKNTKMFPLATSVIQKEIEAKGIESGNYSNPPIKGVIYNGKDNDNISNGLITFYYHFDGDEDEAKRKKIWYSFLDVL